MVGVRAYLTLRSDQSSNRLLYIRRSGESNSGDGDSITRHKTGNVRDTNAAMDETNADEVAGEQRLRNFKLRIDFGAGIRRGADNKASKVRHRKDRERSQI